MGEEALEYHQDGTHQQADRMSAIFVEAESPAVEKKGSDHRLANLLCKAHFSVRGDDLQGIAEPGPVKQQNYSGNDNEHHGKVAPH